MCRAGQRANTGPQQQQGEQLEACPAGIFRASPVFCQGEQLQRWRRERVVVSSLWAAIVEDDLSYNVDSSDPVVLEARASRQP